MTIGSALRRTHLKDTEILTVVGIHTRHRSAALTERHADRLLGIRSEDVADCRERALVLGRDPKLPTCPVFPELTTPLEVRHRPRASASASLRSDREPGILPTPDRLTVRSDRLT